MKKIHVEVDPRNSNLCCSRVHSIFHLLAIHEGRTGAEGQEVRFMGSLRREAKVCASGLRWGAGWIRRYNRLAIQC